MSTGIQACEIVLPGYVLTERIGSGGYAEVWRAEAPGGIEKAVKIVYGHYDDEFASQELKALERIKGVRHPFLLSLERFEILNGRLAILTELADMSLEQRLRQCRTDGLSGIPRDELMRYMADAAEALDFLSQRHNLLHLDIKPENLLISGDHIKVADFGLVKELATRTQNSLVSGMTPTYASPEMFDDNPSAYSDQYSLAIVYQEMLVGSLPFPGRTVAQLAKQHTQAEPQLTLLPAADRPVIAKALAKKPTDRFTSCRAFVDILMRGAVATPIAIPTELPRPIPAAPRPSVTDPDDTKPSSFHTTLVRPPVQAPDQNGHCVTQPVQRGIDTVQNPFVEAPNTREPIVPEDTVDVAVPDITNLLRREQPTLYVAVGGVGIQVLSRLRELAASHDESNNGKNAVEAIAIDTDRDELREACSSRWKSPLSPDDTLHLPLRLPHFYNDSREILSWVSRRWLYNIPRSLETRGYRPLGRIALVDHVQQVRGLIDRKLERLAAVAGSAGETGEMRDETIRVVVVVGTGGGTGAGMAIDIANAARSLAGTRNLKFEVHGFLVFTGLSSNSSSPLVAANTYSLLEELNHATAYGNESTGDKTSQIQLFESREAPFDCVYLAQGQSPTVVAQRVDALDTAARCLALEDSPETRVVLRSCRESPTQREQSRAKSLTLKKLGYASLAEQRRRLIFELAADLADAVKQYWFSRDNSANWEKLVRDEQQAASASTSVTATSCDDATPLALRSRFKEHMSLEFASEVIRQIQCQLNSHDDRSRPPIGGREAKILADSARAAASTIAAELTGGNCRSARFTGSPDFQPLIAAASQRALSRAVETFDAKQAERSLLPRLTDSSIQAECEGILRESLARPNPAGSIASLVEQDKVAALALDWATTNLLQCGSDRRTFVISPKENANQKVADTLRTARPLMAVVPAAVDDVLIVSEESGISPRSIALGLERVFPGIADAAGRLHTRIDIQWLSLI